MFDVIGVFDLMLGVSGEEKESLVDRVSSPSRPRQSVDGSDLTLRQLLWTIRITFRSLVHSSRIRRRSESWVMEKKNSGLELIVQRDRQRMKCFSKRG